MPLRWADFDANFHLRHSVYYDFAATARLEYLTRGGLSYKMMQEHHFGPILFREECVFKREVKPGDEIYINLLVTRLRRDYSRFSFRHEITKSDGTLCAVLTIDGAWIDTKLRKLTTPPSILPDIFKELPFADDFQWDEPKAS
ncbi:MAG: thioesterase family protein [Saprospiraceae bacterium]|nr:thioesterase family protein [Saprospiraceae bacterium]